MPKAGIEYVADWVIDDQPVKLRTGSGDIVSVLYADCLMAQVFQSVACNAAHSIEQRTAKWLLAAAERTGAEDIALTQEQLAAMLGVGRSYLSRVIHDLRGRGVIETRRGRIGIRNGNGLRLLACECNSSVNRHFDDVLKGVYPADAPEADQGRGAA